MKNTSEGLTTVKLLSFESPWTRSILAKSRGGNEMINERKTLEKRAINYGRSRPFSLVRVFARNSSGLGQPSWGFSVCFLSAVHPRLESTAATSFGCCFSFITVLFQTVRSPQLRRCSSKMHDNEIDSTPSRASISTPNQCTHRNHGSDYSTVAEGTSENTFQ